MNIYLAGDSYRKYHLNQAYQQTDALSIRNINILDSYYYARHKKDLLKYIPYCGSFLLDSGAFTFLQNHKQKIDWNRYIEEYADFINNYNINLFFELDIDSIIGYDNVKKLTQKLKRLTQKDPIQVWHKNRGKEGFLEMCKEAPYVALGGVVIKEIPINLYEQAFPWFIDTAHSFGCKIHGLGYTRVGKLKTYHFDSVDSSTWMYGQKGAFIYQFCPAKGDFFKYRDKNKTMKSKNVSAHNFFEWVKFSNWAKINL